MSNIEFAAKIQAFIANLQISHDAKRRKMVKKRRKRRKMVKKETQN